MKKIISNIRAIFIIEGKSTFYRYQILAVYVCVCFGWGSMVLLLLLCSKIVINSDRGDSEIARHFSGGLR